MRFTSRNKRTGFCVLTVEEELISGNVEQNFSQAADTRREHQPVGDRHYRDAGAVNGGAGHFHRQRGAAAHFRKFVGGRGRIHLGADLLSGFERDCAAAVRLVLFVDRTEAVLHVVRGAVYGEFVLVRAGAKPRRTRAVSHLARRGGGRFAPQRAGHFERYVFTGEARHGFRGLRNRRGGGSHHRSLAWRLDYRQFFMALDFLHQRAGGNYFAAADFRADYRSAVHEARQHQERIPHRLHRHRIDQPGTRQHANYFGQGAARRLAVVGLHPRVFRADDHRHRGRYFLGATAKGTRHRLTHAEEPKLRDRHHRHVFPGLRDVCQHGIDTTVLAANAGLYRRTCGTGAVAGWRGDYGHDAGRRLLSVESRHQNTDRIWLHRRSFLTFCDGWLGSATGLRSRGTRAHVAGAGLGIFVYSHQRLGVRVRAAGEEQYGHGHHQPGAQYRRERGDRHGDDDAGAAHAGAPSAFSRAREQLQRGVPQHAEWHTGKVGGRRLQSCACHHTGAADDLRHGAKASRHAGVYRQF